MADALETDPAAVAALLAERDKGESGSLTVLIEHYEETVTSRDNQIYNEKSRRDAPETSCNRKYAALNALLSIYESRGDMVESLIAALDWPLLGRAVDE
ncbi:hypothetical protein [Pseudodesulfovibrio sp.]|uniref:hypothetical protein n=1 Tax=unclassified Pseudodesulfovibrio TaxID=2661612 RepID=UPI003B002772